MAVPFGFPKAFCSQILLLSWKMLQDVSVVTAIPLFRCNILWRPETYRIFYVRLFLIVSVYKYVYYTDVETKTRRNVHYDNLKISAKLGNTIQGTCKKVKFLRMLFLYFCCKHSFHKISYRDVQKIHIKNLKVWRMSAIAVMCWMPIYSVYVCVYI